MLFGRLISGYGLGFWVVDEPVGTIGLPLHFKGAYGHAGNLGTLGWVDPTRGLVGVFLIQRSDSGESTIYELFASMAGAAIN